MRRWFGKGRGITIVPLNDEYSFDHVLSDETTGKTIGKTTGKQSLVLTKTEEKIIRVLQNNPEITQPELAGQIGLSVDGVRYAIKRMKDRGILNRKGSNRNGSWQVHLPL